MVEEEVKNSPHAMSDVVSACFIVKVEVAAFLVIGVVHNATVGEYAGDAEALCSFSEEGVGKVVGEDSS